MSVVKGHELVTLHCRSNVHQLLELVWSSAAPDEVNSEYCFLSETTAGISVVYIRRMTVYSNNWFTDVNWETVVCMRMALLPWTKRTAHHIWDKWIYIKNTSFKFPLNDSFVVRWFMKFSLSLKTEIHLYEKLMVY